MAREGSMYVQASKAILKNTLICLNAGANLQPFTHFIIIFIKGQKHAAYLHLKKWWILYMPHLWKH